MGGWGGGFPRPHGRAFQPFRQDDRGVEIRNGYFEVFILEAGLLFVSMKNSHLFYVSVQYVYCVLPSTIFNQL